MVEKDSADSDFLKKILWTDESTFNQEGITNFHNLHHYARENPHAKMQKKHQVRFSLNVWAGVIGKLITKLFLLLLANFERNGRKILDWALLSSTKIERCSLLTFSSSRFAKFAGRHSLEQFSWYVLSKRWMPSTHEHYCKRVFE